MLNAFCRGAKNYVGGASLPCAPPWLQAFLYPPSGSSARLKRLLRLLVAGTFDTSACTQLMTDQRNLKADGFKMFYAGAKRTYITSANRRWFTNMFLTVPLPRGGFDGLNPQTNLQSPPT